jgi:hypothetical protein
VEEDRLTRAAGQAWIRLEPKGLGAVCLWLALGEGRMLCLTEDGAHYVVSDRGFCLPTEGRSFDGEVERIS